MRSAVYLFNSPRDEGIGFGLFYCKRITMKGMGGGGSGGGGHVRSIIAQARVLCVCVGLLNT